MKKRTFLLFSLLAMLVLTACGGKSGAQTSADDATDTSDNSQQTTAEETAQPIGQHHAQITIKDHGTIDIELDGDAAPISVQNFMDLANDGFYDGLTFHRIITGFMMQGGDPLGNGHRRLGEHHQGRVFGERRGEQAVAHARCGFDGTLKRPGQRILAVLHRSAGQHLSRRSVRLLRLCDQGHGCCG